MGKPYAAVFLVAVCMFCGLLFTCNVNGDTTPYSTISSDTTWTSAGSPYVLSGPVLVKSGATLTLEPGTFVNLGSEYIQVEGALRSLGTSQNPVQINGTSNIDSEVHFTDSAYAWNEQTGSGCLIENTIVNETMLIIENTVKIDSCQINDPGSFSVDNIALSIIAGTPIIANNRIDGAIVVRGGSPTISENTVMGGMALYGGYSTVTGNEIWGGSPYFMFGRDWDRDYSTMPIHSCSAIILNNNIKGDMPSYGTDTLIVANNVIGGPVGYGDTGQVVIFSNTVGGIGGGAATALIERNLVVACYDFGISVSENADVENNTVGCTGTGLAVSGSAKICYNNIVNYTEHSVLSETQANIDLPNNWWGTTDTQAIDQSIYDQKNDFNLGRVTFTPVLNAPNPQALPDPNLPVPDLPSASPTPTSTETPSVEPSQPSDTGDVNLQTPSPTPSSTLDINLTYTVPFLVAIIAVLVGVILFMNGRNKRNMPPPPS